MPAKRLYADLTDREVRTMLERSIPTGLCEHKWRTDGHEHSCSKKAEHWKNVKAHVCLCGVGVVLP